MPHAGNATNLTRRGSPAHSATSTALRHRHDTLAAAVSVARADPGARVRVVAAMVLLVLAKLATVYVPVIYGRIVDALAPKDGTALLAVPLGLVIGYGLLRVGSAAFGELRDALFAKVQQRAVRVAALRTFRHLHALSLRFHLDRQTGALARAIDRGPPASSRCCGSRCSTWCRR